jgi:hypothetical protein
MLASSIHWLVTQLLPAQSAEHQVSRCQCITCCQHSSVHCFFAKLPLFRMTRGLLAYRYKTLCICMPHGSSAMQQHLCCTAVDMRGVFCFKIAPYLTLSCLVTRLVVS